MSAPWKLRGRICDRVKEEKVVRLDVTDGCSSLSSTNVHSYIFDLAKKGRRKHLRESPPFGYRSIVLSEEDSKILRVGPNNSCYNNNNNKNSKIIKPHPLRLRDSYLHPPDTHTRVYVCVCIIYCLIYCMIGNNNLFVLYKTVEMSSTVILVIYVSLKLLVPWYGR